MHARNMAFSRASGRAGSGAAGYSGRFVAERQHRKQRAELPPPEPPIIAEHVKLSDVVKYAPHCFSASRANASGRFITELDSIPLSLQTSPVVYLSNNYLRNLNGIEQFFAVEKLSLASNRFQQFEDLVPLQYCRKLKHLYLQGNPLSSRCYYVSRVISLMSSYDIHLSELDGLEIHRADYERAALALRRHATMLQMLLHQECRVAQLAHAAKLLRVHGQLMNEFYGTKMTAMIARPEIPATGMFQLDVLLRYRDLESSLDDRIKRSFCVMIEKQVEGRAARPTVCSPEDEATFWEKHYSSMAGFQTRIISELVLVINHQAHVIHEMLAAARARDPRNRLAEAINGEMQSASNRVQEMSNIARDLGLSIEALRAATQQIALASPKTAELPPKPKQRLQAHKETARIPHTTQLNKSAVSRSKPIVQSGALSRGSHIGSLRSVPSVKAPKGAPDTSIPVMTTVQERISSPAVLYLDEEAFGNVQPYSRDVASALGYPISLPTPGGEAGVTAFPSDLRGHPIRTMHRYKERKEEEPICEVGSRSAIGLRPEPVSESLIFGMRLANSSVSSALEESEKILKAKAGSAVTSSRGTASKECERSPPTPVGDRFLLKITSGSKCGDQTPAMPLRTLQERPAFNEEHAELLNAAQEKLQALQDTNEANVALAKRRIQDVALELRVATEKLTQITMAAEETRVEYAAAVQNKPLLEIETQSVAVATDHGAVAEVATSIDEPGARVEAVERRSTKTLMETATAIWMTNRLSSSIACWRARMQKGKVLRANAAKLSGITRHRLLTSTLNKMRSTIRLILAAHLCRARLHRQKTRYHLEEWRRLARLNAMHRLFHRAYGQSVLKPIIRAWRIASHGRIAQDGRVNFRAVVHQRRTVLRKCFEQLRANMAVGRWKAKMEKRADRFFHRHTTKLALKAWLSALLESRRDKLQMAKAVMNDRLSHIRKAFFAWRYIIVKKQTELYLLSTAKGFATRALARKLLSSIRRWRLCTPSAASLQPIPTKVSDMCRENCVRRHLRAWKALFRQLRKQKTFDRLATSPRVKQSQAIAITEVARKPALVPKKSWR